MSRLQKKNPLPIHDFHVLAPILRSGIPRSAHALASTDYHDITTARTCAMEPSCGGGAQQHPSNHQRSVVMTFCFMPSLCCFQAHQPTRPPTPPNHLTSDPAMASQMAFHEMSAAEVRRGRRGARVAEAGRGRGARTKRPKQRRGDARPARRELCPLAPHRAPCPTKGRVKGLCGAQRRAEKASACRVGWVRPLGLRQLSARTRARAARAARRPAPLTHPSHASI